MSEHQDNSALAAEAAAWVKLTPEERLAILAKLTGHDPQWPYTTPEFKQTAESLVAAGLIICTEHNGMVVFRAIRADEIRDCRDRKAFTEALAALTEVKPQGSFLTDEECVARIECPAAKRAAALLKLSLLPARPANDIDHAEYGRSRAERGFTVPPPIMRCVRYL
jgi:hypothetical protein